MTARKKLEKSRSRSGRTRDDLCVPARAGHFFSLSTPDGPRCDEIDVTYVYFLYPRVTNRAQRLGICTRAAATNERTNSSLPSYTFDAMTVAKTKSLLSEGLVGAVPVVRIAKYRALLANTRIGVLTPTADHRR